MKTTTFAMTVACCLIAAATSAFAQNQREIAVRSDKQQVGADTSWIYNDLDRGFATARKTRKPLLVLIRCLP